MVARNGRGSVLEAKIHPNRISEITGDSVYDVLMHMSALLPKVVVNK